VIDALKPASSLAAPLRPWRASATLTSRPKTRVRGFCRRPSGRRRAKRPQVIETASGCRARDYETASGRGLWLSMDPIEERGGANLYGMVRNSPLNTIDPVGLRELALIWDSIEIRKLSITDSIKIGLVFRDLYSNLKDLGPQEMIDIFNAVAEVKSSLDTIINANRIDRWPLIASSTTKYYGDVKCFEKIGFVVSAKGLEVESDAVTGQEGTKKGSTKFVSPLPTYMSATIRKRVYFIYQCTGKRRYTRSELREMSSSQLDAIARSQAEPKSIRSVFEN